MGHNYEEEEADKDLVEDANTESGQNYDSNQ